MNPDVSVLTVTYNSATVIERTIESVERQRGVRTELVIVDNRSTDNTAQLVGSRDGVTFIESPDNLGFGRGNNLGFAATKGRFVLLLNPDAHLEGDDALQRMSEHLDARPEVGIVGPKLLHADGRLQARPRLSYPGERHVDTDLSALPGEIAWIIGAAMFVRRSVYEAIQGFDEDFFMYGEETDFCLRARKSGCKIDYLPEVAVRHVEAVSSRGRDPYDVWMAKQSSLFLLYAKAYGPEAARRLVRRELARARLRLITLGLTRILADQPDKHAKYRATRDAARRWLAAE